MDTRRIWLCFVSIFFGLCLVGCGPVLTSTPYLPPTPVIYATPPPTPTIESPTYEPTATIECIDNLIFLDDLTIPDGSIVLPGSLMDKQWLVQNSGTCNWDDRYSLRFINGSILGAEDEQALYPARAGTQATIQLIFTAPSEPGEYISIWQAFNPDGLPFGQGFFIKVIVQP